MCLDRGPSSNNFWIGEAWLSLSFIGFSLAFLCCWRALQTFVGWRPFENGWEEALHNHPTILRWPYRAIAGIAALNNCSKASELANIRIEGTWNISKQEIVNSQMKL